MSDTRPPRPLEPGENHFRKLARQKDWWTGNPTSDKVLKVVVATLIGLPLGAQLVAGMPDELHASRAITFNVPLIQGLVLGAPIGLVLSPIALVLTRGNETPRGVFRVALLATFLCGMIAAGLGWLPVG